MDGDGHGEPEAVLVSPDGLRMTLDQVVNDGQESDVTLAMIMSLNISQVSGKLLAWLITLTADYECLHF